MKQYPLTLYLESLKKTDHWRTPMKCARSRHTPDAPDANDAKYSWHALITFTGDRYEAL